MNEQAWRKLATDFAAELTELKHAQGLTFDELTARSGVSRTYLRDLSSGHRCSLPSEAVVARIAGALEVPPDHFRLTRARAVLASPQVIDTVYSRLRKPRAAA